VDYIGNYIYENGKLSFILTDEGRLVPDSTGFTYEYFIKDHLGNTRVTVKDSLGFAAIQQEAHYYPFGMNINALSYTNPLQKIANKYLYNGKELQDDLGLGWYDYGNRFYDPQVPHFTTIDRFSEKYSFMSPYQYAANNPVKYIDVNGDSIWTVFYNQNGKRTNEIPWQVRKMFAEEFGIYVGYNTETHMLYYDGDYEGKKPSQSKTATEILKDALSDDNKNSQKYGKIVFGVDLKVEATREDVREGNWQSGTSYIDYGDYDDNTGKSKFFDYVGVPTRSHNLARAFEEEYLGHNYLKKGGFGDGGAYTLGKVNRQANLYMKERNLPQRLNYGNEYTPIFFGNPDKIRKDAIKRMVKGVEKTTIHLKFKK
jgi:RHS repeat-associated protein